MTLEQRIARARRSGLVRAVAGAENRAAAARAKGRDAGALEREVAALRAELERVEAAAEGREDAGPEMNSQNGRSSPPETCRSIMTPQVEDAAPAGPARP